MKRFCILFVSVIFLINISYAQKELNKNEIYSRIKNAIITYQQISNYRKSDINSKEDYKIRFKSIFNAESKIINDLPMPDKIKTKVSADEYLDILFDNFRNGLTVEIDTANLEIIYEQDQANPDVWKTDVVFLKRISGIFIDGRFLSLSLIVNIKMVIDNDDNFYITAVTCPDDIDADGIINSKDKCVNMPGFLTTSGCPDSDKDGVPDNLDKCPDTPPEIRTVNKSGCEKSKFFNDISLQISFLPGINIITSKIDHLSEYRLSDNKEWGTGAKDTNPSSPLSFSYEFKATKPVIDFNKFKVGITGGLGVYNYKTDIKVLNNLDWDPNILFPKISTLTDTFDIYDEKSTLHFIGIPVGIKLYSKTLYIEAGINNHFFAGGTRKLYLDNYDENPVWKNSKLKDAVKLYNRVPYAEIGFNKNITEKLGFHIGLKYKLLYKFTNPNPDKFKNIINKQIIRIEETPPFLELIIHDRVVNSNHYKMHLEKITLGFGITYNLNTLKNNSEKP